VRLRAVCVALLGVVAVGMIAHAADSASLEQARRAMAESLPQLAIGKLKHLLADPTIDASTRADVTRLLAEAYLATGQASDARTVLAPLVANGDVQARLLRAHAFARSGAWEDARDAYNDLCGLPDAPVAALVGAAESHQALGETAAAISLLEPLVRGGKAPVAVQLRLCSLYVENRQLAQGRRLLATLHPTELGDKLWERYVEGRILLDEKQLDGAGAAFDAVLTSQSNITENLAAAANLAMAELKLAKQGAEAADKVLETFIWNNADSPWIEMAFRRLDQVYAMERRPEEDQLQKWAAHTQIERAALARFFLAKLQFRAAKWDKAIGTLDLFVGKFPTHRFVVFAELMRADAFMQKTRFGDAISALEAAARAATTDSLRSEIDLRTGLAHLRQQEFLLAATSLERAAERSESLREVATYNAALAWLGQGNLARFQQEYRLLTERGADAALRGNLAVEEALTRARNGNPEAEAALRRFEDQFPTHARVGEARVALAELKMVHGELDEAGHLLRIANSKTTAKGADDQAAALAVFLSDSKSPRDDQETLRLGLEFLQNHPTSPLMPDVKMKLGQVYFRQQDYARAENQFITFARQAPAHPGTEAALFLCGQCAMRMLTPESTDRALAYFDEVAQRNGALKLHAREQQAIIQLRLGKEQEAVALYTLIITSRQPVADSELRSAALTGKGEALALIARKDPQQMDAAIAVYDQIATTPDTAASWRHQAIYRKAKLIGEQPTRKLEALTLYNEILDLNISGKEREFFWFYKAGYEAAHILEQQQQWLEAIAIYEKMGRVEGPHAADVRRTARELRVTHFIWD